MINEAIEVHARHPRHPLANSRESLATSMVIEMLRRIKSTQVNLAAQNDAPVAQFRGERRAGDTTLTMTSRGPRARPGRRSLDPGQSGANGDWCHARWRSP